MTYTASGLVKDKVKTGTKTVRFVQEPKGIIPQILENLLSARKQTRTRMKHKRLSLVDGTEVVGLTQTTDGDYNVKQDDGTKVTVGKD